MKKIIVLIALLVIIGGIMLIPAGGAGVPEEETVATVEGLDLSGYSDANPDKKLHLLFIHHSCGGHLFAETGEKVGENCIYQTHPNGGDLRSLLADQGYSVHEASYKSEVGEDTDIFHWLPKFRDKMDKVLTCSHQDTFYTDGTRNNIVAFKSCYPNNNFVGEGKEPGKAEGPELTVWNAKASYTALLDEFKKHPEVLFVCVTAPALAQKPPLDPEPLWKNLARKVMNKPRPKPLANGPLARKFNNWLKSPDGWLKDYPENNVVVFDYYHILTKEGESNYSMYTTGGGADSHPSSEGNKRAAAAFVPFINRAVRRAGLLK